MVARCIKRCSKALPDTEQDGATAIRQVKKMSHHHCEHFLVSGRRVTIASPAAGTECSSAPTDCFPGVFRSTT